jgi:flagellar protein FliL
MAEQDDLDLNVEPEQPARGRGRGRLWLVISLVVVLGAVLAGGAAFLLGESSEEAPAPDSQVVKPTIYKEIQPALVVNFQGSGRIRYVQVGVVISSTEQRTIDAVERHMPVIRNNLIMLLSDKTYEELNSREGKEQARREVLDSVRQVLHERAGESNVESVYFTSFVMQ